MTHEAQSHRKPGFISHPVCQMTCLATHYLLAKLAWLQPAVPSTGHLLGSENPQFCCLVLPDWNWHGVDDRDLVQECCIRPHTFSSITSLSETLVTALTAADRILTVLCPTADAKVKMLC